MTKSYGVAGKKKLTPDAYYRMGSITKSFTALAVLREVEKGNLSLDDKLSKFVSGVPNGNLITIKHLLMMRSGVYD